MATIVAYRAQRVKTNITLAKKISHTMRYIDDLLVLNNNKFHHVIHDIYPPALELKKTTECPTSLSYLDILISIDNGKYTTAIFDKRDSFSFDIVNFPHLSSNIPAKPAYGVYISQLVHIDRICSTYEQFKERHYKLTKKLITQGFWYSALRKTFKRFTRMHIDVFSKYGCSVRRHIEEGICMLAHGGFMSRNITTRR